eukprot:UN07935
MSFETFTACMTTSNKQRSSHD